MAITKYSYTKKVNVAKLQHEISIDATITTAIESISRKNNDVDIYMKAALATAEETALTSLVTAHDSTPIGTPTLLLDDDGATMTRPKMAAIGRHQQLHGMLFTTAMEDSFQQRDANDDNLQYGTMTFYDVNNIQVSGTANMPKACKTTVDWEPPFDYEIMGGVCHQMQIPSGRLVLNVIALPDIPTTLGGNIRFVLSTDLRFIGVDAGLHVAGQTTSELIYSPTLHTNKIQMTFHHASGLQHDLYLGFEIFV